METQTSRINPNAPENRLQPKNDFSKPQSGRALAGLVIVAVGGVLLARQLGVDIPGWIFGWETMLIVLGIYIGARHNFRDAGWVIPVIIGGVFLFDDIYYDIHLTRYMWPVLIIGVGLFMILKSRKGSGKSWTEKYGNSAAAESSTGEDVIECTTFFGGVKKNIISKTFRGGEAVTVFGGTELNLLQAESTQPIHLELVQIFGGTKLIVPQHWKIHTEEMVTIFGGLNDKRAITTQPVQGEERVLIIKGTCLFGGIDIKSY